MVEQRQKLTHKNLAQSRLWPAQKGHAQQEQCYVNDLSEAYVTRPGVDRESGKVPSALGCNLSKHNVA